MSNKMNFEDRIESGEFTTKLPSPSARGEPFIRGYATEKMKQEHAEKLAKYKAELPAHEAAIAAHREDQRRLDAILKAEAIIDLFGDDAKRFPDTIESLWKVAENLSNLAGSGSAVEAYYHLVDIAYVVGAIKKDLDR